MSVIIENLDQPNGKATEFLLKSISNRLSGREDCRRTNYIVTIDHNGVRMAPLVNVFPNKHTRHEGDKLDVVSFIHQYKMPNTLLSDFVFGTYEYQTTPDGKRRKWRKVK